MKKLKIILVSLALLLLVIGVVSAEETGTNVNVTHPVTTVIGGLAVGDQNTATIKFFDDEGAPYSGSVTVTVNGNTISTSGSSISVSVSLPTDTTSISISNGATGVGIAKASSSTSGSVHADVNKRSKSFAVILKDNKGTAIKNKQVTVTINGVSKSVKTDDDGKIIVSATVSSNVKSVDVLYSGAVVKSDDSSKKPVASKIKASKKTFKVKTKTKKFPITLTDKNGKVIAGKKVTLTVNGKSYTAKTGNNGKATFKITKLNKKGTYKASVKFAGDKSYTSSNAAPKIVVKK